MDNLAGILCKVSFNLSRGYERKSLNISITDDAENISVETSLGWVEKSMFNSDIHTCLSVSEAIRKSANKATW